jgi:hypothetical protein
MRRREFLRTAGCIGLSSVTAVTAQSRSAQKDARKNQRRQQRERDAGSEFYELREYRLSSAAQQGRLEGFLEKSFIPALQRLSISPVGVFHGLEAPADGKSSVYVLIKHAARRTVLTLGESLSTDNQYKVDAEKFDSAAAAPYEGLSISVSKALDGIPRMELPARAAGRIFQLRIYRSPSETAAERKRRMFTGLGELALFRKVGLTPVFFGETLIGDGLPNLTYMLSFKSMDASKKAWADFGALAEWQKLKATPGFTDKEIISKITNLYLAPAACSQI